MKATDVLEQQHSADREIDNFLTNYESRTSLSKRMMYCNRLLIRYPNWLDASSPVPFDQGLNKEPMIKMYIPQHQFQRLVRREGDFQDLIRANDRAHRVLHQSIEDERIRDSNPSVQAAWMKYRTLLELSRK